MPAESPLQPFITSAPAFLSSDDPWTFDLGEVAAGTPVRALQLGVNNTSQSDTLVLSFDPPAADSSLRLFLPDFLSSGSTTVNAHTGVGAIVGFFDAAGAGRHEAMVTMHVFDQSTGEQLPDVTIRLAETVVGTISAGTIPSDAYHLEASRPDLVAATPMIFHGSDFARIASLGSWSNSGTLDFAPSQAEVQAVGPNYLLATFQMLHADLAAAGSDVKQVDAVGIGGGNLTTGDGSQQVFWSFASASHADISTGAGDDTVTVTAIGVDTSENNLPSTLPYAVYPGSVARGPSAYDGTGATATVDPGTGDDTVVLHPANLDDIKVSTGNGLVENAFARPATTIVLHPGDGQDTVVGFWSGTDGLEFHGVDPAAVRTEAMQVGGADGLLVTYDAVGDSVFLTGVTGLGSGDLRYAEVPSPPPPDATGPTDWNTIAQVVLNHWEQTGEWVPYDQLTGTPSPMQGPATDWNAIAEQVQANYNATGYWFF